MFIGRVLTTVVVFGVCASAPLQAQVQAQAQAKGQSQSQNQSLAQAGARMAVQVRAVVTPAGVGSGMYALAASADGQAYLSWIEPDGAGHALKFSRLSAGAWSAPVRVARGDDWFVNWADHPSVVPLADGALAAHWLVKTKTAASSHGYGLRIAHSRDAGTTWRQVFEAGMDNTTDYAGFVSLLPAPGGFLAAYLTPMKASPAAGAGHEGEHVKMLAIARFAADGRVLSDDVLDRDTCTCCTTSMVATSDGPLIAYRDHQDGIRDISIVRQQHDGRWTAPQALHRDGWEINGCPTNGPALASAGKRVAAAWFTAANEEPHVKVAFSTDAGATFQPPVIVDGGQPVGWTGIVLLDDGGAVVSWLESLPDGRGEIRLRRVSPDGKPGAPLVVATSKAGRTTGMPQLVRAGQSLVVAWRSDRVQSAIVPLTALDAADVRQTAAR
jgi:hypothetical protein